MDPLMAELLPFLALGVVVGLLARMAEAQREKEAKRREGAQSDGAHKPRL